MPRIFALVLLIACASVGAPVKKTAQRSGTQTAAVKTTTSKRSTTARSKTGHRRRVRARKPPAPSYQLHPDSERYAQIQQALGERGYFKGQANGQWGDDSVDALKRFQADQKLDNDGKLSAHTLTALGLGPKHDGTSATGVPLAPASEEAPQ